MKERIKKFCDEHELLADFFIMAAGCGLVAGAFALNEHIQNKRVNTDPFCGLTEEEYRQCMIALNPELDPNSF